MSRDVRFYLTDMLTSCEKVLRYTAELSQMLCCWEALSVATRR
jgi:uncharacterized protein with HEPN domain